MLVELKAKSQVTIPKEIVSLMNLSQGDKFEIIEENGRIVLIPLEVYPKNVIDELKASVEEIKASIDSGERPVFDSIDALFEELDK
ncbi:AbrB/MazE/SpoVT family DNA-binding domain-containing protein [Fenollaria timonensis]|uniref:AbrB/MazE/SpoVT family DNA-binding domain-containing protein n=1 Tax=Fenollaria timonensis TaxID=1723384 RepID=UPI00071C4C6C|nr:AbrB/MazE/SpoVT family DNA-binding domain-containing protein [Fenollaria timonensis]